MGQRSLVVVGDRPSRGGAVASGAPTTDAFGMQIARLGDRVVCAQHGPTTITTGDHTFLIDGKPVARHGDHLACSCRLLSSQQHSVFVETGSAEGGIARGTSGPAGGQAAVAPLPSNAKPDICEACLMDGAAAGAPLLRR